jgi:hypothetical protein
MACGCSDTRPEWARELPDAATLDYVRNLSGAVLLVAVLAWLIFAVVRDPRAVWRIGRKQVGA